MHLPFFPVLRPILIPIKVLSLVFIITLSTALVSTESTSASFSDEYGSSGHQVTTGTWVVQEDDVETEEDVVINEIMWMGSSASVKDHWIELRNTLNKEVSIGEWQILNAANGPVNIPAGTTIPAKGFYLISKFPANSDNSALNVSIDHNSNVSFKKSYSDNGQVKLLNEQGSLVDSTPVPISSSWTHGIDQNNKNWSMQRGSVPGDGTISSNWYTCDRGVLEIDGTLDQMKGHWKPDHRTENCGTPGYMNLSSNDPTKSTYTGTRMAVDETMDEPEEETIEVKEVEESPEGGTNEDEVESDEKKEDEDLNDDNFEESLEKKAEDKDSDKTDDDDKNKKDDTDEEGDTDLEGTEELDDK